jgi:hypothetical protein
VVGLVFLFLALVLALVVLGWFVGQGQPVEWWKTAG